MGAARWVFKVVIVFAAFAWGLSAGFYQVFPYQVFRHAKNALEGDKGAPKPIFENPDAFVVSDADLILSTKAKVVMVGDSVTAGGRWQEMFPGVDIVNRGVGGDTVTGVLRRAPRIVDMAPKRIFLLIGINDVVSGNQPKDVLARYDRAVGILVSGGAKVFVQSILACGERCDDEQRAREKAINAALPEIAERHGAVWVNLNGRMATGGRLKPQLTWDGIHLTGAGYAEWREVLTPLIK